MPDLNPDLIAKDAIYQLQSFIQDFRSRPAECVLPQIAPNVLWVLARSENLEVLRGLAMLPYLPEELKEELFTLYLSFQHEEKLTEHGYKNYRACEYLGAGLAANPSLSLDQYFAIPVAEGDISHSYWNNPCAPPEMIYSIYLNRTSEIDEAVNPPSWIHHSMRLQGDARWDAEISNSISGFGRLQAAFTSLEVEDRFNAFINSSTYLRSKYFGK